MPTSDTISTVSLGIVEARTELTRLPDVLEEKPGVIAVTRRGKRVLAILTWQDYESLLETMEILRDPKQVEAFRSAVNDIREGSVRPLEHLRAELDID